MAKQSEVVIDWLGGNRPVHPEGMFDLVRNADNNIGSRLAAMRGVIDLAALEDPGDTLFRSYRHMAIANGVSPNDPILAACRGNDE